ncbi:ABC transporter permease subunit [Paenibacillus oryzisoli]|uniref:ABC transporter permease n=1 Tax=Paenibacillus oryzisoli TaxID=1850517 RepID=UPI003D283842
MLRYIIRNRWLYVMMLPGIVFFLIFKYLPMWGVLIAFQNYQPFLGFSGSEWVGFAHFERFFSSPDFWLLTRNTLILAMLNLVFFFPAPIIIALMLNEVRIGVVKRFIQTIIYIPHFFSWVVIIGIVYMFFSSQYGIVNQVIASLGGNTIDVFTNPSMFRPMITLEVIWKETGWGTIIFLAALAGVNAELYEAARIDGANRWRQLIHITLPAIRSTIVILFILRLGHFLDTGFEQIFLMLNALTQHVGDVYDTYVYRAGITQGQFSYSTAVGLFKSLVGLALVAMANYLARLFGEEGIY